MFNLSVKLIVIFQFAFLLKASSKNNNDKVFKLESDINCPHIMADKSQMNKRFNPASVPNNNSVEGLAINLYFIDKDNLPELVDGVLAQFNALYSNTVDNLDGFKFTNINESLSLKRDGVLLTLERRQPITKADTLFLNLTAIRQTKYEFNLMPQNFSTPGFVAFFSDSYLRTETPINLDGQTKINFSITSSPESYAANRFSVVFKPSAGPERPATFALLKAYQQNGNLNIDWKVEDETGILNFQVAKSTDGKQFFNLATVPTREKNDITLSYKWIDTKSVLGNNYYRISSTNINGQVQNSNVIKLNIGKEQAGMQVYPNPVVNKFLNLQFYNQPKGSYTVSLISSNGKKVLTRKIQHDGSSSEILQLENNLLRGNYYLELVSPYHTKAITTVLIY